MRFFTRLFRRPVALDAEVYSDKAGKRWYWKLENGGETVGMCDGSFAEAADAEADLYKHFRPSAVLRHVIRRGQVRV